MSYEENGLKVGGNEKQRGSGRSQMLGNGLGPWRSRFIYNLNTQDPDPGGLKITHKNIKKIINFRF